MKCLFCDFQGTKDELIAHSAVCEKHPLWKPVDVFVDDYGTAWTQPTAEAYMRACKALTARTVELEGNRIVSGQLADSYAQLESALAASRAEVAKQAELITAMDAEDKGYEAMFERIAKALGVDTACISTYDAMAAECERAVAKLGGELPQWQSGTPPRNRKLLVLFDDFAINIGRFTDAGFIPVNAAKPVAHPPEKWCEIPMSLRIGGSIQEAHALAQEPPCQG